MSNCVIKRKEDGSVDRVYNPIILKQNKEVYDKLTNSLEKIANKKVFLAKDIKAYSKNTPIVSKAGIIMGYQTQDTMYLREDVYDFRPSVRDIFGIDMDIPLNSVLAKAAKAQFQIVGEKGASNLDQTQQTTELQLTEAVQQQLQKSGLVNNFYLMSNAEIEAKLKELGYSDTDINDIIAFHKGGQEKQITVDGQQVTVKVLPNQLEVVNGFYSPIEKALLELNQSKGTAAQFLAQIKKAKGVKQEELQYTGIEQFLTEQGNNKITKQDILDYMKENRIEIVEVVKGEGRNINDNPEEMFKNGELILEKKPDDGRSYLYPFNVLTKDGKYVNEVKSYEDAISDPAVRSEARAINKKNENIGIAKYSQFQLEGEKENYKEVLVTMPDKKRNVFGEESETLDYARETYGINSAEYRSSKRNLENRLEEELGLSYSQIKELFDKYEKEPDVFKSSHFDEPNILVHLRMNTRTDADGNKVLFIEELQSDFAQIGRKEGFKLTEKEAGEAWDIADKKYADFMKRMERKYGSEWESEMEKSEVEEETKLLDARENTKGGTIPQAPFVTDTNAWTKLGLKVALKEAVKQGADKIAWTTGEQQNERYSLEKVADEVRYKKNADGTYKIKAYKNGENVSENKSLPESKLEETLGKDVTERILNGVGEDIEEEKSLTGENLKVGGSGMKGFYGSPTEGSLGIVGNVAKSLFNQEPKTVKINTTLYKETAIDSDLSTQYSIDITPELKAQVQEQGLPLFQIIGEKGAANLPVVKENLQVARDMEAAGKTPKEIYLTTGWERSKDKGKWKYDLPDIDILEDAVIELRRQSDKNEKSSISLQSLVGLDNELFKAYPDLKFRRVLVDNNLDSEASYTPVGIRLSKKVAFGSQKNFKSTLIHEIQHAIQDIEGFAKGGNRNTVTERYKTLHSYIVEINEVQEKIKKAPLIGGETKSLLRRFSELEKLIDIQEYNNLGRLLYDMNTSDLEGMELWREGFPKIIQQTNAATLTNHPSYEKAKAGDLKSANEVVESIFKDNKVDVVKDKDIIIVPVLSVEAKGNNKLPLVFAAKLASKNKNTVAPIYQVNKTYHTGLNAAGRMLSKPIFEGEVKKGGKYVITDDVVTSGSTVSALKEYIEENGGYVVSVISIANSYKKAIGYSGQLALLPMTEKKLTDKFGENEINSLLLQYGITDNYKNLTNAQAKYLTSFKSIDKIRETFDATGFSSSSKTSKPTKSPRLSKVDNNEKLSDLASLSEKAKYATYFNLAGEAEARNVERRAKMTEEERRNTMISETEDVAEESKIYLYDNDGTQESRGIKVTTNGFIINENGNINVYVNKESNNPTSTLLHEYSHAFIDKLETERPDLFQRGVELSQTEEAQPIIEFVKRNQPNLKEGTTAFYKEVMAQMTGEVGAEMIQSQKKDSPLAQWINDVWDWIKSKLGLTQMTNEQVQNLTLKQFAEAVSVDLMRGQELFSGDQAQEYFTRNADRLPLTLSVFSRPEFVQLQGKQVNPITVLNSLNQTGIKQIEKDLIKKVIEDNYQGQKKISYDELEATVRANIMPLERIFTSSHDNDGMDNLGNGNYGEANTIILNAPIEHGVTGQHFPGDFKASNRTNIKYVPKQLNDNTWVAVEEGYEQQGANPNNIYSFVGTAGTKEAVEQWIREYERPLVGFTYDNTIIERIGSEDFIVRDKDTNRILYEGVIREGLLETDEQILEYIDNTSVKDGIKQDINKGMFGHIRVWQDGEVFTVAELQSDYFQKNNAKKFFANESAILKSKEYQKKIEEVTEKRREEFKKAIVIKQNEAKTQWRIWLGEQSYGVYETKEEAEKDIEGGAKFLLSFALEEQNIKKDKDVIKYFNSELDKLYQKLSPQEKQFIASQKEWEKRMVREAIKEASMSGATSLRFPTPYTLSVIEGYVNSENNVDKAVLKSAVDGQVVKYLESDYIVVYAEETFVQIAPVNQLQKVSTEYFNRMEGLGNIDANFKLESEDGKFIYFSETMSADNLVEVIDINEDSSTKDTFQISSLSDAQQTVANRYLEIAEILKQERGEENVEIITDENGFDWYETKIESSEVNNPIIAFQNQAGITKAEAIKRNNGNPLNLAPNGKPSILYQSYLDLGYSVEEAERLTAQVYSDSFFQFFGDWINDTENSSKVIDSNGQPLIMWHNTDTDFTEYSFQEKGKNTSFGGSVGKGIYTTTKERAEGYGGKYNKPLFLNIRNPRTTNISYSDSAINLAIRLVNEEIDKSDYPDKNYAKRNAEFDIRDKMQKGITPYVSGYFTSTIITEVNKAEGFDGVFDGSSDKVVFNPNQIKSATENIGTFDSGSNDIRFQIEQTSTLEEAPITIKTPDSALYNDIASNPILTEEESLQVFSTVFTDTFKSKFGDWENSTEKNPTKNEDGEPKAFYKTTAGIFDNYKDALNSVNEGEIELGYVITEDVIEVDNQDAFDTSLSVFTKFGDSFKLTADEAFLPAATLPVDTNPKTKLGFVNMEIKKGYIAPKKVKVGGKYKLVGEGANSVTQLLSARLAQKDSFVYLGTEAMKVEEQSTITIDEYNHDVVIKDGVEHKKSDLFEKIKEGKLSEVAEIVGDIGRFLLSYVRPRTTQKKRVMSAEKLNTEKEKIMLHLMQVLSDLGISVTTITNYAKNYKLRNGVDLSVEAIADIANNVVAFADGSFNAETLAEETAHIIIEAYENQDEISEALRGIRDTKEWAEYAEIYYEKYSQMYKGEELERAVEKEILGKALAARIMEGFATQDSFTDSLFSAFERFVQRIKSFFVSSKKAQVNNLLDRLANLVIQGETLQDLSKDNLMQSNLVLYNVNNQQTKNITSIIDSAINSLERRANQLSKVKDISAKEIKANIIRVREAQKAKDYLSATQHIIESITPSISAVQKAIKSLEDNSDTSTREFHNEITQTALNYLNNDGITMIETMRQTLLKLEPDSEQVAKVARVLQDMSNTISSFKGMDVFDYRNSAAKIIAEQLEDTNITEEAKVNIIEAAVSAEAAGKKDISSLFSFFGGLTHVSNIVLKVLGQKINNVYYQAEELSRATINPIVRKWVDKGWNKQSTYSKLFARDENGKKTGMYIQERDEAKHSKAFQEAKKSWIQEILTEPVYNDFVEKEGREPSPIDLTTEQSNRYYDKEVAWKNENNVRFFLDEYYVKRQERYSRAGVSTSLREFLNNLSARRQEILSKYREGGRVQYHLMSKEDLLSLQELDIIKKDKKSEYLSATGVKKTGESLNDALALQALDQMTYEEYSGQSTEISDDFFDTMEEIEAMGGREAAVEFFMANGGLTFSDEYWAEVTKEGTAIERLEKAIVEMENKYMQNPTSGIGSDLALLERLSELHIENLDKRKQIIKQFGKRNNPAEVDTELMTQITMDSILELDGEINDITVKINTILNKNGISLVNSTMSETSVNESYNKDLIDSGMSEFNFVRRHLTDSNRQRVKSFQNTLSDVRNNIYLKENLPKYMIKYLENMGITTDIDSLSRMSDAEIDDIVLQYAKTKVASYYKRFSPPGYNELIEELRNSPTKKATDIIKEVRNGVNQDVKVRVSFDWLTKKAEDDMVNPEYTKYSKVGYGGQIPSAKYQNDEYITMFNPDQNGRATTNTDLFEMLEDMKELNQIAFDKYGIKGKSLYSAVKKSRQNYEKITGIAKKGVKEFVGDLVTNRIDDKLYGDTYTDMDLKTIPQYFIDNLEDNDYMSEDILHTMTSLVYEANLYKQKKHAISDALILQQTLYDSKFEGGKEGKDTNTYKMYKEFMDAYFYGIRYNKQYKLNTPLGSVDFSKLITSFDTFQRHVNIAFNPFIAASSAGVANISLAAEKLVGQDLHKHSYSWAKKEAGRMIPEALSEYGALTKSSTLYKLQEKFGLKDLKDRLSYTGYSKLTRISKDAGFAMMEGLASPHQFDLMLSTLDDFRLVNDKYITYNQFKRMAENKGKDDKIISLEWKSHQKNSLYYSLDFESDELKIKDEISDRLGKEYTDKQMLRAFNRIVELNTNVDAVLNKTDNPTSTRHPIARVAMAHTGWLTIMLQRKFKGESLNLKTGEMERGHFMSAMHYLKELYKSTDEKGVAKLGSMLSNIPNTWNELSDHDKRGIKRVVLDHAILVTMLQLIAYGISLADDDDRNEDNWALHFTSFLFYRTVAEYGSNTLLNNVNDVTDKLSQPFMAVAALKRLSEGFSTDKIESGKFEGYRKFTRALIQSTHLRHLYNTIDIENTSRAFVYRYNADKFKIFHWLKKADKEEEEGKDELMGFFDSSSKRR